MKKITFVLMTTYLFTLSVARAFELDKLKSNLVSDLGAPFSVEANIYRPTERSIRAILVLFPTIAGVSPLETLTAKYFVKRGFLVIVPLPFTGEIQKPVPSVEGLDDDFNRPTLSANAFIDQAEKKFQLSPSLPIFALGASQGGIRTVGLTAENPRVKAAWFAVAGGDFPAIYAHSQVDAIAKFRENHKKILAINSDSEYEQYLRNNLKYDPLTSCGKITAPIIQVIALKDEKVPTKTQIELENSCPPHKVYKINAGHVSGSASILLMKHRIYQFFLSNV